MRLYSGGLFRVDPAEARFPGSGVGVPDWSSSSTDARQCLLGTGYKEEGDAISFKRVADLNRRH